MARILIGWASRAGAARDIATVLADELRTAGHDVDVADLKTEPDASSPDLVVLGSGIQAGQWYPEAMSWVTVHEVTLTDTPVALFNVCLNAADCKRRDESLGYNKALAARLEPVAQESFAGRYVPEKVSRFKRLLLKSMRQQAQDHVDEALVRTWARELAYLVPR